MKHSIFSSLLLLTVAAGQAQAQIQIKQSFQGIRLIYMMPPKGDCRIQISPGTRVTIALETHYDGDDVPAYSFLQQGDTLTIRETYHPASVRGGMPVWTLQIPMGTQVSYKTGAGSISVMGLSANLELNTGKGNIDIHDFSGSVFGSTGHGNIELRRSNGMVDLHTGTGNILLSASRGTLKANTGRGHIDGENLHVDGPGTFLASSGDCRISLEETPAADLTLSSASGSAVLNYNGHLMQGEITFHVGKGVKIASPFVFERTRETTEPGNQQVWISKSITIGQNRNHILLSSAKGSVQLKP